MLRHSTLGEERPLPILQKAVADLAALRTIRRRLFGASLESVNHVAVIPAVANRAR
jgi:hypothetical protein